MIIVDGVTYSLTPGLESYEWEHGIDFELIRVKPPRMEARNVCAHCGRADWTEVVAFTFQEAVEKGWFVRVSE